MDKSLIFSRFLVLRIVVHHIQQQVINTMVLNAQPTVVLNIKTQDEVLTRGLELVGYSLERQARVNLNTRTRRFKKLFGPNPVTVAVAWSKLQTTDNDKARLKPSQGTDLAFDKFLMFFYFIKGYGVEEDVASRFDVCEETMRKWVKLYAVKLAELIPEYVKWPSDDEWGDDTFIISVDCVNFGTNEPRHPTLHKDKKRFDRKNGKAGLTYEIGLHLWENRVVWFNGGFPPNDGGDRNIFVEHGLNDKIPDKKKAIADKIYTGLDKIALHNSLDDDFVREFKGRARSRQESINARLKSYSVLRDRFRHGGGIPNHQLFAEAVMVVVIISMNNGSPLYNV